MLKYMRNTTFVLAVFMALIFVPVSAKAEVSIAVVSVQKLLSQSNAAKSIQEQSDKYRDKFLKKLVKQEEELRELEKKLVADSKTLSKEEFIKQRQEFEKTFVETQKEAKERKKDLDKAYGTAMKTLMDNIYEVVQGVASEKGYNIVLAKQHVVVGENSLDITEESMKRLNEKLSSVNLGL